ncbi:nucleotide exchange factor GrpE [Polynucleobacter sp. IMCC30063]|uniref:nucleotide exchange factor GrpE n=1 Tax=unclassified Polynucleobacter TaxID=2640945 RepID=UPI001F3564A2|nr:MULTISPECIES: nucleotide exchange factor GrpE [unclassified Polynucleobacter]MCE7506658.1 nucleotide exchange factor GrpE [Polynucleobacter sp. IMCC30063]MCE7526650.1 nucleotide exchange factor GrpE [Polynucleobacter sp. IMCC 30228]MCE7530271.1 nucleotide exchange factor GrpE [Polynucleobacter sp. IMCC 29146]
MTQAKPDTQTPEPLPDDINPVQPIDIQDRAPDATSVSGVPAAEVAELNQKLSEMHDNFLRAKAEGENIRRRAAEDIAKAHKFAIENFAEHLIPVADSLHAALATEAVDAKGFKEGLDITLKQLASAFEKGRIAEINPATGDKFDPHLHQAIAMVPADQDPNTVVSVLQRGYSLADRILRPALVTVSETK